MSAANQSRPISGDASVFWTYGFGPYVLDTLQQLLKKDSVTVPLTPKTYDTLLVLVQNSGRMLSKEELMQSVWPDSFVEESNLTQQVSMIRRALGESPSHPQYIVTVPGRGYRFSAEVRACVQERTARILPDPAPEPRPAAVGSAGGVGGEAEWLGSRPSNRARTGLAVAGVAGLLMVSVLWGALRWHKGPSVASPPASKPRTLAILPLQNLKADPADDFLGFSLADSLITKLNYVSAVSVRPSAAVQPYRNQVIDIPRVAESLNADTLLTGTFVRDGDDLRITYQLVEAKGEQILGKGTIDLKYDKLLRVQDTVAEQIIRDLALKLSPSEAEELKRDAPVNPLAYEYYLRGVDLHGQHDFPLAIRMLEKSTEIDPSYAPAWAFLGASYNSDAAFELRGREQYRRAQAAYERALALDPAQLEAQTFFANLLVDTGQVEQAVPLLRKALEISPSNAAVHWELGYAYRFAGMEDESVSECERARQLDASVKANGSVLNAYLYLGEYDKFLQSLPEADQSAFLLFYRGFGEFHQNKFSQATSDFDRAFALDPSLYAQIGEALGDSVKQRTSEGEQVLHKLEQEMGQRGVGDAEATYKIAETYSVLGDKASALRVLRKSVEGGFFAYPYLSRDPLLDGVRDQAEFARILDLARGRYQAFRSKFF